MQQRQQELSIQVLVAGAGADNLSPPHQRLLRLLGSNCWSCLGYAIWKIDGVLCSFVSG